MTAFARRMAHLISEIRRIEQEIYDGPLQELLASLQDLGEPEPDLAWVRRSLGATTAFLRDVVCDGRAVSRLGGVEAPAAAARVHAKTRDLLVISLDEIDAWVIAPLEALDEGDPAEWPGALRGAIGALRQASERLHPSAHDHAGFAPALRKIAETAAGDRPVVSVSGQTEAFTQTLFIAVVRGVVTSPPGSAALDAITVTEHDGRARLTLRGAVELQTEQERAESEAFAELFAGRVAFVDEPGRHEVCFELPSELSPSGAAPGGTWAST